MPNEVRVIITGQDRSGPAFASLDQNAKKAEASTRSLADKGVDRASRSLDTFKATAATGATVAAGLTAAALGVQKVMGDGITVALTEANAQVALGEQGFNTLSAAADANANAMGFTRTEFLGTAGSAASLAKNLGFTQEASAKLGAAFPDLADKLAILSNGKVTTAEAADQLRSAMAGEFDPLQSLGIAINAAAVETEALKIQQASATEITKEQATSMAVLAIVQRQTADASKVMATEAGRAAAEAQASQARLKQAYEELSQAAVPILADLTAGLANMAEGWKTAVTGGESFTDWLGSAMKVMSGATFFVDALVGKTKEEGDASQQTALDVMSLAEGAQGAARTQEELAAETKEATDAIKEQASAALDGRDAAREWEASLDEATDALKENGRTLNRGTEAGRANEEALDNIARSALDVAESIREAGGSEADYRRSLERSRVALVKQARTFGMTAGEAEDYASEVLGIPKRVNTTIGNNVRSVLSAFRAFKREFNAFDGAYIGATIGLGLRGGGGIGALGGFRAGGARGAGNAAAGGGGRSGFTLVGEEGPELVPLSTGSMVHERATSSQIMRRAAQPAGGPIVVELVLDGRVLARQLVDPMRSVVRSLGGNVQTAYGDTRGAA